MKKVLIIGGCGYIGSRLYNFLTPGYHVDTVDLEWFGNYVNTNNIIKDFRDITKEELQRYDAIILLAGHSSVKMCENNMVATLKNNVLNFVELLDKIDEERTFIYASSSSIYGDTKQNIVKEDYTMFKPNNYYDLSKHEIDSYAILSNKKVFGLRFGTVNGMSPNLRNDIMINAMVFNAIKNDKVFCFNPEIYRPILGIQDLCRSIYWLIEKGTQENKGVYNLASFNSTAAEISQKVAEVLNVELEITNNLPKVITNVKLQTKAYNFLIDSEKFKNEFDFEFKETIESIIVSIVENFEQINKEGRSVAKLY